MIYEMMRAMRSRGSNKKRARPAKEWGRKHGSTPSFILWGESASVMSKDIQNLHQLGLISKVCSELDNHLGFSDKTLAEFNA